MDSDIDSSPEREPLLTRYPASQQKLSSTSPGARPGYPLWPTFTTPARRFRFVPFLGCLIVFLNESEYFIKSVASLRAIEAMYCFEYYSERDAHLAALGKRIPERLCKDDKIQMRLATTAGLIMFVRMLSAMIGAIPLGWVSDRKGRKVVLVLHKINIATSCAIWLTLYLLYPRVPVWSLYFSGIPGLFGGNFDVGLAMLFASYTDVMPSASQRASLFFLTTSMQYLAQIICPSIGAWLMNLDGKGGTPHINLVVSLALSVFVASLIFVAFPETLHEGNRDRKPGTDAAADVAEATQQHTPDSGTLAWCRRKYGTARNDFRQSIAGIGVVNVLLLWISIFSAGTGIKSIDWFGLVQYPVVKFRWTFPEASSVVSIEGVLILLNFSVILPTLNRTAAQRLGSPGRTHFAIMAGSSVILVVGSTSIGFSPTSLSFILCVVLYTFGVGLPTAIQAYIVSLIDKSRVARVMAILSIASIGGKLAASVLFPQILAIGLQAHTGVLVGLPFFVSAALFGVSAICVSLVGWRVKVLSKPAERDDEAE